MIILYEKRKLFDFTTLKEALLILDGSLEIGVHVISIIWSVEDMIRHESSYKSYFFSLKITIFLHACAACSEIPSNKYPDLAWIRLSFEQFQHFNILFLRSKIWFLDNARNLEKLKLIHREIINEKKTTNSLKLCCFFL